MERVLAFDDALQTVLAHAAELRAWAASRPAETVPLLDARGRTLAEPVRAPRDQPPFDRSTRDGYAVRAADVRSGAGLRLLGCVRAGERWQGPALQPGEALEIMTGAPLPEGADAVLMVEHSSATEGRITPAPGRTLVCGENIVPQGAEARHGDTVLGPGQRLDAAAIALAASCGQPHLRVVPRARVAVLSTGDELVELGSNTAPEPWQIVNSNSYALAALLDAQGATAERLPIAPDRREPLDAAIAHAHTADLLLLSGGVSMGKYDLVEDALRAQGAEFLFTGAKIQPGKPVVFGRLPRNPLPTHDQAGPAPWLYFFGLPGNPVSTEVCFHLFVAPLLSALSGVREPPRPFVEATAAGRFSGKPGLVRFLPAQLGGDWRAVTVSPVPWQGSGDLAGNARADGFCVVEEAGLEPGQRARVLLR